MAYAALVHGAWRIAHGLAEFLFLKFNPFFSKIIESLENVITHPPCILIKGQKAIRPASGLMPRCANLGSGHILPPLWDGVYGERWGWAAADVTAGPT